MDRVIYLATWEDGRRVLVRGQDEERARECAIGWREADTMRDAYVSPKPTRMEFVPSRGPLGILLAGWENP